MKKIVFSIIITIMIINVVFYKKNNIPNCTKIAILIPVTHDSLEKVKNGFIQTISLNSSITYDIYNSNGDQTLLKFQAQEILSKKYSLIFAIATSSIVTLGELQDQQKDTTPIIAAVGDISQVKRNPLLKNILDISIGADNQSQEKINILLDVCKPTRLVIPYTPVPMIETQIKIMENTCKKNNIEFISIPIYNQQDIAIKLDHHLRGNNTTKDNEVVLVLQDNMILAHIEKVINICNKKNSIIFTSSLEIIEKGATIAYDADLYFCGSLAGNKGLNILIDKLPIEKIDDIAVRDNKLKINYSSAQFELLNKENLEKYSSIIIN